MSCEAIADLRESILDTNKEVRKHVTERNIVINTSRLIVIVQQYSNDRSALTRIWATIGMRDRSERGGGLGECLISQSDI